MKKLNFVTFLLILAFASKAQETPTYLTQTVDVTNYQNSSFIVESRLYIVDKGKELVQALLHSYQNRIKY